MLFFPQIMDFEMYSLGYYHLLAFIKCNRRRLKYVISDLKNLFYNKII